MNDDKLKVLNNLVSNIDCLEPLYKWTNDLNIFNILKLDQFEIRHSNMLAWLLNPNQQHGLYDKLLKKILIYATNGGSSLKIMKNLTPVDVDILDLSDVTVEREKNNIDILVVSEKNKLVLAIENKIFSSEHSNQLDRYRNLLIEQYGDNYRYVLIYLSPERSQSSDQENWIDLGYEFIADELTNFVELFELPDKAKLYIEDYVKSIRRTVMEDVELKELCQKLYYKHQEAFDLIFENKPDKYSLINDNMLSYLKSKSSDYDIDIWDAKSSCYIRFTPKKLEELYGTMGNKEWCKNENLLAFEIQNFKGYDSKINVTIGPSRPEYEEYRQKILDLAIKSGYNMKGQKIRNKWKTIKSDVLLSKKQIDNLEGNLLQEECCISIDKYLKAQLDKIIHDLSC